MILKGTGSNPRGRATEPGLHVALILGIIFVMGVIPTGGLEASAGATAGLPLFPLITEPEAMDTQRSAMEQWLLELGFVYDKTVGRVRNPFDFPRGEADPALKECFVALGGESDYSNRRLIVGPAGSGKTAQLIMLAQGTTHLQYQSAVVFAAVWNDIIDTSISSPGKTFSIVLDVDDSEHAESSVIEQLLDQIYTLYVLPQNVNIYIALPGEFLEIAEPYKPWKLQWEITRLEKLIKSRVKWATKGKSSELAQFCDTNVVKPDNTLASLAQTPRRLFELGRYLFHVHTRTISPFNKTLLQASEWETLNAYAQFRSERKPPSTSVSSPPVAHSIHIFGNGNVVGSQNAVDVNTLGNIAAEASILPETSSREWLQSPPPATSHELKILDTLLKRLDDSEYERLLMFEYPSIYDQISRGMRHDEKVNLLLDYCHRNPEKTQEIIATVNEYIEK
ncbi:MAG TPA: hypothetical protein PLM06_00425 [Anaerolineae bacterium]|nr:hypothetical protein [Anaerolineae bacterium]